MRAMPLRWKMIASFMVFFTSELLCMSSAFALSLSEATLWKKGLVFNSMTDGMTRAEVLYELQVESDHFTQALSVLHAYRGEGESLPENYVPPVVLGFPVTMWMNLALPYNLNDSEVKDLFKILHAKRVLERYFTEIISKVVKNPLSDVKKDHFCVDGKLSWLKLWRFMVVKFPRLGLTKFEALSFQDLMHTLKKFFTAVEIVFDVVLGQSWNISMGPAQLKLTHLYIQRALSEEPSREIAEEPWLTQVRTFLEPLLNKRSVNALKKELYNSWDILFKSIRRVISEEDLLTADVRYYLSPLWKRYYPDHVKYWDTFKGILESKKDLMTKSVYQYVAFRAICKAVCENPEHPLRSEFSRSCTLRMDRRDSYGNYQPQTLPLERFLDHAVLEATDTPTALARVNPDDLDLFNRAMNRASLSAWSAAQFSVNMEGDEAALFSSKYNGTYLEPFISAAQSSVMDAMTGLQADYDRIVGLVYQYVAFSTLCRAIRSNRLHPLYGSFPEHCTLRVDKRDENGNYQPQAFSLEQFLDYSVLEATDGVAARTRVHRGDLDLLNRATAQNTLAAWNNVGFTVAAVIRQDAVRFGSAGTYLEHFVRDAQESIVKLMARLETDYRRTLKLVYQYISFTIICRAVTSNPHHPLRGSFSADCRLRLDRRDRYGTYQPQTLFLPQFLEQATTLRFVEPELVGSSTESTSSTEATGSLDEELSSVRVNPDDLELFARAIDINHLSAWNRTQFAVTIATNSRPHLYARYAGTYLENFVKNAEDSVTSLMAGLQNNYLRSADLVYQYVAFSIVRQAVLSNRQHPLYQNFSQRGSLRLDTRDRYGTYQPQTLSLYEFLDSAINDPAASVRVNPGDLSVFNAAINSNSLAGWNVALSAIEIARREDLFSSTVYREIYLQDFIQSAKQKAISTMTDLRTRYEQVVAEQTNFINTLVRQYMYFNIMCRAVREHPQHPLRGSFSESCVLRLDVMDSNDVYQPQTFSLEKFLDRAALATPEHVNRVRVNAEDLDLLSRSIDRATLAGWNVVHSVIRLAAHAEAAYAQYENTYLRPFIQRGSVAITQAIDGLKTHYHNMLIQQKDLLHVADIHRPDGDLNTWEATVEKEVELLILTHINNTQNFNEIWNQIRQHIKFKAKDLSCALELVKAIKESVEQQPKRFESLDPNTEASRFCKNFYRQKLTQLYALSEAPRDYPSRNGVVRSPLNWWGSDVVPPLKFNNAWRGMSDDYDSLYGIYYILMSEINIRLLKFFVREYSDNDIFNGYAFNGYSNQGLSKCAVVPDSTMQNLEVVTGFSQAPAADLIGKAKHRHILQKRLEHRLLEKTTEGLSIFDKKNICVFLERELKQLAEEFILIYNKSFKDVDCRKLQRFAERAMYFLHEFFNIFVLRSKIYFAQKSLQDFFDLKNRTPRNEVSDILVNNYKNIFESMKDNLTSTQGSMDTWSTWAYIKRFCYWQQTALKEECSGVDLLKNIDVCQDFLNHIVEESTEALRALGYSLLRNPTDQKYHFLEKLFDSSKTPLLAFDVNAGNKKEQDANLCRAVTNDPWIAHISQQEAERALGFRWGIAVWGWKTLYCSDRFLHNPNISVLEKIKSLNLKEK